MLTKARAELADAHPGLEVEALAASGGPAGILVAESAQASLIVVGTRASGGLRGHLSASVAVQVAAHASCPVVAVRGQTGRRCDMAELTRHPVVVGLDGSQPSVEALDYAVEQAIARDVSVRAVLVWSLFDVHDEGPIVPVDFDITEEQEKAERLLDEATTGWADRYPELRIERIVVHDIDPVRVLVDESHDAGLVVVGSRGLGGFTGLLLGSTGDGLIRNASVPVAVVHAADRNEVHTPR
jgi:nucleotide-binding universal stress UspA family protein